MKKNIGKKILSLLIAFCMVSGVQAVEEGFYLGGQIGQSNLHNPPLEVDTGLTSPLTVNTSPSNKGIGARIFGGYNFNPYAAFEAGFTYYSPSVYKPSVQAAGLSNPTIKLAAVDLVAKATLPLYWGLGVFAKGGVVGARRTASNRLNESGSDSSKKNYFRPTAGFGVNYEITQNWVADLSFSRIFGSGNLKNADFVALGIAYYFVDRKCGQFLC